MEREFLYIYIIIRIIINGRDGVFNFKKHNASRHSTVSSLSHDCLISRRLQFITPIKLLPRPHFSRLGSCQKKEELRSAMLARRIVTHGWLS